MQDTQKLWSDEVRDRLTDWAAWTRGNQLIPKHGNVLAQLIKRAAGEVPGLDTSVGYELTFEIEAVEKAVARLRVDARNQHIKQKRYMKAAKRALIARYLGRRNTAEIAEQLNCSEDHVKALLWYAESYVGRVLPDVEKLLKSREKGRILGLV